LTSYETVNLETKLGYYPFTFHPAVRRVSNVNSIHSSKATLFINTIYKATHFG